MPNYDYVQARTQRPLQGAPTTLVRVGSNGGNAYYGRVNLTAATAVVSTTYAAANSIIGLTIQNQSPVTSAGAPTMWGVQTIAPGIGFTIGQVTSVAMTGSFTAHWELKAQA